MAGYILPVLSSDGEANLFKVIRRRAVHGEDATGLTSARRPHSTVAVHVAQSFLKILVYGEPEVCSGTAGRFTEHRSDPLIIDLATDRIYDPLLVSVFAAKKQIPPLLYSLMPARSPDLYF